MCARAASNQGGWSGGWDTLYRFLAARARSRPYRRRALKFASSCLLLTRAGYRSVVSHCRIEEIVRGISEPSTPIDDSAVLPPGLSFVEQICSSTRSLICQEHPYQGSTRLDGGQPGSARSVPRSAVPGFVWRLPLDYRVRLRRKMATAPLFQRHVLPRSWTGRRWASAFH